MSDHKAFRLATCRTGTTFSIFMAPEEDLPYGVAATVVSPVSMAPPTLLVSINRSASIHEPLKRICAFGVNLLGDDHEEQCFAFSDKPAGADLSRCGSWQEERGMPLLADGQANIYCEIQSADPVYSPSDFHRACDQKACVSGTVRPLTYLDRRPRPSQSHLIE